jgi:thioredoxin-related protein
MKEARLTFVSRLLILNFAFGLTAAGQEIPPEANRPVTSPGNAVWATTPEEARSRAAADNKLVFIELETPDCGNCRRMDNLLYPAFDFEALLIGMVPVKVNLDSPEGVELGARYGVSQTPAILITSPEGRLVFRMEGFMNAPDFYSHVHQDLDAYRQFARRVEAQDVQKLDALVALRTGSELYQRSDPGAALPRLKRVVAHPKATQDQRDEAREILAAVELDLGQPKASRQTIDRLIATTKSAERRERAELFRAQLPLAENKPAEAIALFKKFRKDHPRSQYLARVDEILEKISPTQRNP